MKGHMRTIVDTRNTMDEVDCILDCIGVAVTARPLQFKEMHGVLAILQWTAQRLGDCSQDLGTVIDQLGNMPN
jgi:hypothetical protein